MNKTGGKIYNKPRGSNSEKAMLYQNKTTEKYSNFTPHRKRKLINQKL